VQWFLITLAILPISESDRANDAIPVCRWSPFQRGRQTMKKDLAQIFNRYFDVLPADSSELLDDVFKLRYQVYCVENSFENAADFPDQRERDRYDDERAVYSVVRHHRSGLVAATVRLILPNPTDPRAPFPIEESCRKCFAASGIDPERLPRNAMAEISRFAVSKDFKRRLGESGTVAGVSPKTLLSTEDPGRQGARMIPHLILGLFTAIVRMSAAHKIAIWYAVMEPSLLRLLERFGIHFVPIGGMVNYHGMRQPCYGAIDRVLAGIWQRRPDVWRLITDGGTTWPKPEKRLLTPSEAEKKLLWPPG